MKESNELPVKPERLKSLDALRGFDMFWIIGGGALFESFAQFTNWQPLHWWAEQLQHVHWEGFNFEDMIFPLFLFISGVSVPLSVKNRLRLGHTRKQIHGHAFIRLIILIVLGFLLANWGIQSLDFSNYRYTHVLMRIGIGCYFATLIFLNTNVRGQHFGQGNQSGVTGLGYPH